MVANHIEALIFDLDDTLYSENEYAFKALRLIADYIGYEFDLDKDSVYKIMMSIKSDDRFKHKRFETILEMLHINLELDAMFNLYRTADVEIYPFPDAIKLMDYLLRNNYKIGLITNGDSVLQRNKLRLLKLYKYFTSIIITDELGIDYRKPNSFTLKMMANDFNIDIDKCIFVGNDYETDIGAAIGAGMKWLLIDRNYINKNLAVDDETITKLTDVIKYLR